MKLSGIDCLITPPVFVNVADKRLSLAVRPPFSAVTGSLCGPISQGHRAGPFSRSGRNRSQSAGLTSGCGVDSAGCRGDVANRAAEGHLVEARVFPRGEKKSRAGLKPGTYILRPLDLTFLRGLRRTLAGRILRMAALPARWQARHIYQLATVR
jgi:hypothetical protein